MSVKYSIITTANVEAQPVNADTPYLTSKQAARYLNVPYSTFRKHATQIKRTRTKRYTRDALDKWAQSRR